MRIFLSLILLCYFWAPLSVQASELIALDAPKISFCANVFGKLARLLDGVDYLAAKAAKPWKFSELEEMRFGGIFFDEGLSHDNMILKLMHSMVRSRADKLPEKRRESFLAAYKEVFFPEDPRFTKYPPNDLPAYLPSGNTIMMGMRDPNKFPITVIHETDHAHLWNKHKIKRSPLNIIRPTEKYLLPVSFHLTDIDRVFGEARAMGAEWELASRIPKKIRLQKMKEIERELKAKGIEFWEETRLEDHQDDPDALLQMLAYLSYEKAGFSKEKFIREMLEINLYTMRRLVKIKYIPFKRYLIRKTPGWILIGLYFL